MTIPEYLFEIFRLHIVITLLAAAWAKTANFAEFQKSLNVSFKVPAFFSMFTALIIIAAEWGTGLALLTIPALYQVMFVIILLMFSFFAIIIGGVIFQGKIIRCNCFGRSQERISIFDLARNILLISTILYCIYTPGEPGTEVPIDAASYFMMACISYSVFLLTISLKKGFLLITFKEEEA